HHIERPGGQPLQLQILEPVGVAPNAAMLFYVHGGGFTMGAPSWGDAFSAGLVLELGCRVAAPSYRLAPEHVYPAAIEDVHAALDWLHRSPLQFDRQKIAIIGESAGGAIAASVAAMARDRGDVRLAFQWLLYPMLDHDEGETHLSLENVDRTMWSEEASRLAWRAMLGAGDVGAVPGPYAVPARLADISRLPRTLIQVGALDILRDDAMNFARRLLASGIPTDLQVFSGAIHGFIRAPDSVSARSATQHGVALLDRWVINPPAA
ncbi:MAG: alpha/beta hydrolase, partial [Burkholderiales bacterium]